MRTGSFNFFAVSIIFCVVFGVQSAKAQRAGGGMASGASKVYDAAGKSAAVKGLQQKMNTSLLRSAISRAGSGKSRSAQMRPLPASPKTATSGRTQTAQAVEKPVFTSFTPTSNDGFADKFAQTLGSNEAERDFVKQLFVATKDAFEKEVAAKRRDNNLAAAMTFFIATTVTVYHDDPEPSDEATDKLWDGLDGSLNDLPEVAAMSDAEKQEMYDTLVGLSGLVLVGHMSAKQTGDTGTGQIYKALAGELIKTVLKTDPAKLRFGSKGLNVSS